MSKPETATASAFGGATMVREARTPQERDEVYRLRYEIYVEEQAKRFRNASSTAQKLSDDLDDSSTLIFATDGDEIVGALRKTWLGTTRPGLELECAYALHDFAEIPAEKICLTSRLVVRPKYRGSKLLHELFRYAYRISRERDCQLDFCNCALPLYRVMRRLGYRRYKAPFIDPDVGERLPLVGIYEDMDYLRVVDFPFMDDAVAFPNSPVVARWFDQRFSNHRQIST